MDTWTNDSKSAERAALKEKARQLLVNSYGRRDFFYHMRFKVAVYFIPLAFALLVTRLPFNFQTMPREGVLVLSGLLLCHGVLCLLLILTAHRPVLTMTAEGIMMNRYLFGKTEILWEQVESFTDSVVANPAFAKTDDMFKIVYLKADGARAELMFSRRMLAQGAELLELLQQIIPAVRADGFVVRRAEAPLITAQTITYGTLELNQEGFISRGASTDVGVLVPWEEVIAIRTVGFVIAGYGAVDVGYRFGSQEKTVAIKAATTEEYRQCVGYLLAHADKAAIDAGVYAIAEYPVNAAKADYWVIGLLVSGFLLGLTGLIILTFYPPTMASTWTYPLLLIPLCLLPLIWTIKLLVARISGGGRKTSTKIMAAMLFNGGTVLSVCILFAASPASFLWMLADANALTGHIAVAEGYYRRCEPGLSRNSDFLFTMGQFNYKKKDWSTAADYYLRAYELDPTNWIAAPLKRIPETLALAGRKQEAVAWCDRILADYAGRKDVLRVISGVRKELGR